jgi:hypothetical protein
VKPAHKKEIDIMTSASRPILAAAIAFLILGLCAVPQADARRIGGVHVRPHIAHGVGVYRPRARVAGRYVRRPGRWVNGVWIVNGVAASVAVGTASNCNYYYRKWKATGSSYWHDRYYEMCR